MCTRAGKGCPLTALARGSVTLVAHCPLPHRRQRGGDGPSPRGTVPLTGPPSFSLDPQVRNNVPHVPHAPQSTPHAPQPTPPLGTIPTGWPASPPTGPRPGGGTAPNGCPPRRPLLPLRQGTACARLPWVVSPSLTPPPCRRLSLGTGAGGTPRPELFNPSLPSHRIRLWSRSADHRRCQ